LFGATSLGGAIVRRQFGRERRGTDELVANVTPQHARPLFPDTFITFFTVKSLGRKQVFYNFAEGQFIFYFFYLTDEVVFGANRHVSKEEI